MSRRAKTVTDLGELDKYAFRDHIERCRRINNGGKRVVDFFREMDHDKSGELTKKEFGQALKNMGFVHATNVQIDDVWHVCDADGSGTVVYKELDQILRRIGNRPEPSSSGGGTKVLAGESEAVSNQMHGRFPKEISPDATFAQPTYVQGSALKAWRQRELDGSTISRCDTESTWSLSTPASATTSTLTAACSTLETILRSELSESPHSSLAAALSRVEARLNGSSVCGTEPAQLCLDRSPHKLDASRPYPSDVARPLRQHTRHMRGLHDLQQERRQIVRTSIFKPNDIQAAIYAAVPTAKRVAAHGGSTSTNRCAREHMRDRLLLRMGLVQECRL